MTAPRAPLPDLREGAEAWVTEHVSCPNPNCKRLNLCAECMTIVSDLRERDRQWRDMVLESRARLAEVEAERDEAARNATLYNKDMMRVREYRDMLEARLARLRPLVRAAVTLWRDGPVVSPLGHAIAEGVDRMDPSDRAWSLGDAEGRALGEQEDK